MININEMTIDNEACQILDNVFFESDSFECYDDVVFAIADHVADHQWINDSWSTNLLASYWKDYLLVLDIYAESDNKEMWNSQAAFQVLEAAVYRKLQNSDYHNLKLIMEN